MLKFENFEMNLPRGRFGDTYLLKVWGFTVIFGNIIFTIFQKIVINIRDVDQFLLLSVLFGALFALPSLVITEISYLVLSKKYLSDGAVFLYTILVALCTTIITYLFFLKGNIGVITNVEDIIFCLIFSAMLLIAMFYFKKNTKLEKPT